MAQLWTVEFCDCGGFEYCTNCELPCDHDRLCRDCRGWEWHSVKVLDFIALLVAKDAGWLYRTQREAWASIED